MVVRGIAPSQGRALGVRNPASVSIDKTTNGKAAMLAIAVAMIVMIMWCAPG